MPPSVCLEKHLFTCAHLQPPPHGHGGQSVPLVLAEEADPAVGGAATLSWAPSQQESARSLLGPPTSGSPGHMKGMPGCLRWEMRDWKQVVSKTLLKSDLGGRSPQEDLGGLVLRRGPADSLRRGPPLQGTAHCAQAALQPTSLLNVNQP